MGVDTFDPTSGSGSHRLTVRWSLAGHWAEPFYLPGSPRREPVNLVLCVTPLMTTDPLVSISDPSRRSYLSPTRQELPDRFDLSRVLRGPGPYRPPRVSALGPSAPTVLGSVFSSSTPYTPPPE